MMKYSHYKTRVMSIMFEYKKKESLMKYKQLNKGTNWEINLLSKLLLINKIISINSL